MSTGADPRDLRIGPRLGWLDMSVAVPADRPVLIAAAAAPAATDIAVRAGGAGLGGALLVAVITTGILAGGRVQNRQARLIVALAPVFGIWLFLRTSLWQLAPDLVVAVGLAGLGVSLGRGSVLDLTIPSVVARGLQVLAHGLAGPAYVGAAARTIASPSSPSRRERARAVARGILIAVPILAVLGLLLASADAVFATIFRIDVDPPSILVHVLAMVLGAWAMGGLLRAASGGSIGRLPTGPHLGWEESVLVALGRSRGRTGRAALAERCESRGHRGATQCGVRRREWPVRSCVCLGIVGRRGPSLRRPESLAPRRSHRST